MLGTKCRHTSYPCHSHYKQDIDELAPKDIPENVIPSLIAYYHTNKPNDSDWVVLTVANFDAYFGTTSFSRKWLGKISSEIMEQRQDYGMYRIKVLQVS